MFADAFDINGYVTIKELLSDDEVAAACGGGAEGLKALAEHPVLLDYVAELVGTGAGSSALPVLLGMPCELPSSTKSDALLGAPGVRAPGKRTPRHRPALEGAGVRAFFVLDDGTPALALLPASHRSAAPAPDAIISEGAADTMLTHPQIFAGTCAQRTSMPYAQQGGEGVTITLAEPTASAVVPMPDTVDACEPNCCR
jgi:hypothetical protein